MPVILIEGPEKAGKSTLVRALLERIPDAKLRKFTGPMQGDEYLDAMLEDTRPSLFPMVTIWDRGWVSEFVYTWMLERQSKLTAENAEYLDILLREAGGIGIILLGPDVETLAKNRDETDLDVDPKAERVYFEAYAMDYTGHADPGWLIYRNKHSESYVGHMVALILRMLEVENEA